MAHGFGELAEQFDDLCDVVVVFAVFATGLRVEEIVAGNKFEDLEISVGVVSRRSGELTIDAILQISVLAPHRAPRITSGDRYCRVWISLVKWWPTQHALPRSAIFTDIV